MAGLTWILSSLCAAAAGFRPSASSPVLHSARAVRTGQNVSLSCNLTSAEEVTWILLRPDRLLPLVTVTRSKVGVDVGTFHIAKDSHVSWSGDPVRLDIWEVQEDDAGLYFCTGRCVGGVCVGGGILLTVNGDDGESTGHGAKPPCWSSAVCVVAAFLASVCSALVIGLYLRSGKPAVCCCSPVRRVAEEESLHYSSLKHPDKPRPSGRAGLVEESITYSTVACPMNPTRSHDHR
ncbi:uncharacterized protein [Embiotoca jacksoni]|uniref:uncharacterized protein isoform X1 n=1 Tax=Embiotoca jacksoni TaxID=100190 RepID=UPI003703BF84